MSIFDLSDRVAVITRGKVDTRVCDVSDPASVKSARSEAEVVTPGMNVLAFTLRCEPLRRASKGI